MNANIAALQLWAADITIIAHHVYGASMSMTKFRVIEHQTVEE